MGRPTAPLIDRQAAITKALEIIDRDGLDGLNMRKLGKELGVTGASLYHHFRDKEEILQGVRILIHQRATLRIEASTSSWQEYVTKSVLQYRSLLLRHPRAAPLITSGQPHPVGLRARDLVMAKMIEDGVPTHYCFAIIDSAETLSFGSALLNPTQLTPAARIGIGERTDVPSLAKSIRKASRTADTLFRLELETLLDGWTARIERERVAQAN